MIELFGKYCPWGQETLSGLTSRIIKGDTLTLDYRKKVAHVAKYTESALEINYELACLYVKLGIVGLDSGNLETGEKHYGFLHRA